MREVNFAWENRMSVFPPEISPGERELLLISELLDTIEEVHAFVTTSSGSMPQFAGYKLEEFSSAYGPIVRELAIENLEKTALTEAHFEKLIALSHLLIGGNFFYERTTGIVISGFGEAEIYPALQEYSVGGVINNTVRYAAQRISTITRELPVDVIPFAQTDSIWGFLNGITPKMQERVVGLMDLALSRFSEHMLEKLSIERTDEIEKVLMDATGSVLDSLTHERGQFYSHPQHNHLPFEGRFSVLSRIFDKSYVLAAPSIFYPRVRWRSYRRSYHYEG